MHSPQRKLRKEQGKKRKLLSRTSIISQLGRVGSWEDKDVCQETEGINLNVYVLSRFWLYAIL